MNRIVIPLLLIALLALFIASSCRFDPCGGRPVDRCVVLPSLNKLFQTEFEICVTNENGAIDCYKILK